METEGWSQLLRLRKGRGHEKWAIKRGMVMQIYARDHVEVHPQKKKEVLHLVTFNLNLCDAAIAYQKSQVATTL